MAGADVEDRIYTMHGGKMKPLASRAFELEADLQQLIAAHPELLAWEQIQTGEVVRWILVKREMGIAKEAGAGDWWAVDHLFIDQGAVPTLVEVKRGNNPQIRREVVGQMLEYAAHASQTWTANHLREAFETTPDSELELRKLLEKEDAEPDQFEEHADKFWERVGERLEARHLRLLFVADDVPDELVRIVEFLNAITLSDVQVLAVEIKRYEGESELQTLVPRVIGRTAKRAGTRKRAFSSAGGTVKMVAWRWLAHVVREESGKKVGLTHAKVADCVRREFQDQGIVVNTSKESVDSYKSYAKGSQHDIPPDLRDAILAIDQRE